MPEDRFEIFSLVFPLLVVSFIVYRAVSISLTKTQLEALIRQKLETDNSKVKSVSKLAVKERLKYGDPPIGLFRVYNYYFGISSGKLDYSRKVIMEKESRESEIKYVSISVKNKNLYHFREFDSYSI